MAWLHYREAYTQIRQAKLQDIIIINIPIELYVYVLNDCTWEHNINCGFIELMSS